MQVKKQPSRQVVWEKGTPMGDFLRRALVQEGATYASIAEKINEEFDTSYTGGAIKSAARRHNIQISQPFEDERIAREVMNDKYLVSDRDSVPLIELPSDREWFPLWATSDWHIGSMNFAEDEFLRHRRQALGLGAGILGGGDHLETAVPTHMPQTMWGQSCTPEAQQEYFERAIKGFEYGMVTPGNHERRVVDKTSIDPLKSIVEHSGLLYRRYGGAAIFRFDNGLEYIIFQKHGSSASIRSEREVEQQADYYSDADVILLGHDHKLWTKPVRSSFRIMKDADGSYKRKAYQQHGVRTGNFLHFDGYVETRPYAPGKMGSAMVWLNSRTHDVYVQTLTEDQSYFMDLNDGMTTIDRE